MKKFISILLLAAMLLALTACGAAGKAEDTAAADKLKEAAQKVEEATAAAEEAAHAEETAEEAAEAAPAEEAEETYEAEEMIGEKSGNSYANETLGIRAAFSDNWTILDDEQTAQMLGLVADNFSEVDLAEQLRESGSLYDLYAMTVDQSGDNVNVVIEDLGVVNGIIIDEKKYLEIAEDQLETTFAQMGMTDVTLDKGTYSFAGEDHVSVLISGNYNGVPVYERMVLLKTGNYMGVVTAFSLDTARLDGIMGLFSAYEG
ncbi:MAG: hypothetical protein IKF48_07485 [Oscillospiraceae bacterium]|nr:hypothetical protein [Oscillospiraceae bacterium]